MGTLYSDLFRNCLSLIKFNLNISRLRSCMNSSLVKVDDILSPNLVHMLLGVKNEVWLKGAEIFDVEFGLSVGVQIVKFFVRVVCDRLLSLDCDPALLFHGLL